MCENCLHCWLNAACFVGGDQGLLNMYFRDWATKDIARHLPFIYNVVSQAFYSYLPAFTQWVLKLRYSSGFIIEYSPLPNKASLPSLITTYILLNIFLHIRSLYWLKLISSLNCLYDKGKSCGNLWLSDLRFQGIFYKFNILNKLNEFSNTSNIVYQSHVKFSQEQKRCLHQFWWAG